MATFLPSMVAGLPSSFWSLPSSWCRFLSKDDDCPLPESDVDDRDGTDLVDDPEESCGSWILLTGRILGFWLNFGILNDGGASSFGGADADVMTDAVEDDWLTSFGLAGVCFVVSREDDDDDVGDFLALFLEDDDDFDDFMLSGRKRNVISAVPIKAPKQFATQSV